MSETQKNGSANENGQGTTKAVPWTELDRAIVLNNILGQLHASSGKSLDWTAISEALPSRTTASMRAVWDRYRNDMKTAAAAKASLSLCPTNRRLVRTYQVSTNSRPYQRRKGTASVFDKAEQLARKSTPQDRSRRGFRRTADAEDVPETPAKKRGGGAKKRASGADGEEGSATKKKRTPKKTPAKKTPAKVEEEEEASEETEPPTRTAADVEDAKNSDEDMKDTAEAEV
ncbi:predicted protein [Verticillium alfalfae VaMs.102]|uniref:Predicted protein n=1 Tax=Verticillium alfalfae (strain VaMs.102 / ATCC MYA-4576 / FGSC 10136) TaxID=526221 RepID=C9S8E5_VERA1|nr:predicted protein [Verticillium alfalfae VaMs.102]EEY14924.1 predicted protein [Verticillium alfalfae VaMs.102]